MTNNKQKKKEKYSTKLNILLLIVVVLDFIYNMRYMNQTINQLFNPKKTNNICVLKSRLNIYLKLLFDEYKRQKGKVENDTQ